MYAYGLIGNCQVSALVSKTGSLDWLCMPRPDSEPIFGKILDDAGGAFSISLINTAPLQTRQYYLENTNILITEIGNSNGDSIRITDFCPRFEQYGRMYRPISIFRTVEPLTGSPNIKVCCNPILGWNKNLAVSTRGNSHLKYDYNGESLRLTTNMPLTYLCEESAFNLKEKLYYGLTWSAPIEDDLVQVTERFLQLTKDYWQVWVKHCSIPSQFQTQTIRSALALKLHCFEDTGAILAAITTSLPEELGGTRNWDYRYCWLRDAHFVLSAFHKLGHFEEMEGFLKFLIGVAQKLENDNDRLAPVYSLSQTLPLPETLQDKWSGFKNSGPVRTFNQAAEHIQNDVYGEMALTLAPIFFDDRFIHLRGLEHCNLLIRLARLCEQSISQPDAGLWEVRNGWQEHSFTNLMCWAGLERTSRIQNLKGNKSINFDLKTATSRALVSLEHATHQKILFNGPKDQTLDASLALAAILRVPNSELCLKTVEAIRSQLSLGTQRPQSSFFYRYLRKDDFGKPHSAFVICSFWVAQALAILGHKTEAKEILEDTLTAANHVGLFSEHFDPTHNTQLGNFPQAYSHVGLINAAFAVSPDWSEVL